MGSRNNLMLNMLQLFFAFWSYYNEFLVEKSSRGLDLVNCAIRVNIWQKGSVSSDATLVSMIKTEKVRSPIECILSCYGDQMCASIAFTEPDECSLLSVGVGAVSSSSTAEQPTKYFGRNSCWRGDYTYNSILDVCFKINYYNEEFSGARKACQADGGDLLTIKSLDMEVYLRPMLNENPSILRYWVGGRQTPGSPNNWTWTDGTEFMSELWAPNEPNNVNEECAEFREKAGVYVLNDSLCNDANRFICQIF